MNIIEYENYHEHFPEGNSGFPYLTYPCSIPHDFTQVPLHWHEDMELVYVKKGMGTVSVDFIPCKVRAGDIIFICPGQLHLIQQYRQESMEYENIIFPLSLLNTRQMDVSWEKYLSPVIHRQVALPLQLCPGMAGYQ
ncbi:MAG: cupin domain-containing protein, partial [Lachnospiraceae bacterium]|nr:cupin domain-containing protein [Lachnospiraceae bacterium]